jgi:hypothetical protein
MGVEEAKWLQRTARVGAERVQPTEFGSGGLLRQLLAHPAPISKQSQYYLISQAAARAASTAPGGLTTTKTPRRSQQWILKTLKPFALAFKPSAASFSWTTQ